MEFAKSKNRLRPAMKDPLLAILLSALIILLAGTGTTSADERSISLKRVGTYASGILTQEARISSLTIRKHSGCSS